MERKIELRNVNVLVEKVRQEAVKEAERSKEFILLRAEEKVKQIDKNRQALAMLDAAGFDMELYFWQDGSNVTLDLGFFPRTKAGNKTLAETLRRAWVALGCQIPKVGKEIADAEKQIVHVIREAKEFPGIKFKFQRKLSKEERKKCRIVKHRTSYTSLECSVD